MNKAKSNIKVIVMTLSPLTVRWADYFCTDSLQNEFDLEYWDCSKVAFPAFSAVHPLMRSYAVTISDRNMLEQRLKELPKDTLLLSDVHFTDENASFHRLVGKYISNCIYFDIWSYSLGTFSLDSAKEEKKEIQPSLLQKIKHWIYGCEFIRLFVKYIRYKGDDRYKKEYQLYLMRKVERAEARVWNNCAKHYRYKYELSCDHLKTYVINHPDVEKYLSIQMTPAIKEGRYVVYLDQYFPLHPDLEEVEPEINHKSMEEPFYKSVNKFFSDIEQQLECKVIIAAHPVANYRTNPFEGREIIYYKTAELIKDSIGVCLHYSSAANFIALYDKPFVLFDSDSLQMSPNITRCMNKFASIIHAPVYNIDEPYDSINEMFMRLDPKYRNVFMNIFMGDNNHMLNRELFPIHLRAIYNEIYKIS